jgi:hypothetical protein
MPTDPQLLMIDTRRDEHGCGLFEFDVPRLGTQIVFAADKFKKFFSVQPYPEVAEVAAQVAPHGLGGFTIRL